MTLPKPGQRLGKLGFLVNPIAGMGGRVGLKGTDGEETLRKAIRKGARPTSPDRARKFLEEMRRQGDQTALLTGPGKMGEEIASQLRIKHETLGQIGQTTTSEDTVRVASLMRQEVDLITFCGGDGTARDILKGVDQGIQVLGIPSGVKVYSSVFAISPVAAAVSAVSFLHGPSSTRLGEVVDVDEEAFRKGRLSVRLFGYLSTPDSRTMVQGSKSVTLASEDIELDAIADHILETILPGMLYVLGPGSTVEWIAKRLEVSKTPLGVDVVRGDGVVLGRDLDEAGLIELVKKGPAKVIVSPIGRQGFLFGRGNQQISPDVLRMVGVENVIVVSTRAKTESLQPRRFLVDSGDDELDGLFRGYVRAVTGFREEMIVKVE